MTCSSEDKKNNLAYMLSIWKDTRKDFINTPEFVQLNINWLNESYRLPCSLSEDFHAGWHEVMQFFIECPIPDGLKSREEVAAWVEKHDTIITNKLGLDLERKIDWDDGKSIAIEVLSWAVQFKEYHL